MTYTAAISTSSPTGIIALGVALFIAWTSAAHAQRAPAAQAGARTASVIKPLAKPSQPPTVAFNRANFGPQSQVNPGLLRRAYRAYDATKAPDGARGAGLKSGPYRNDAKNGEVPLPRTTATGTPITYQRVNLRPGSHQQKWSNARAVVGSDKSVWVSRHYGQDGGKVRRVQ